GVGVLVCRRLGFGVRLGGRAAPVTKGPVQAYVLLRVRWRLWRQAVAWGPLQHLAEPQLGRVAHGTQGVLTLAGHRDHNLVAAFGDHLGLLNAEGVDPALDDLPSDL